MTTGKIVPTLDGLRYFSEYEQLGTASNASADTIYKIPFAKTHASEEYHGNGVLMFTTAAGDEVMALTNFVLNGATLVRNPWKVLKANGGGEILQRFGLPRTIVSHRFGVSVEDAMAPGNAAHNVQYTLYDDGRDSLTMFVNTIVGSQNSCDFSNRTNIFCERI